MLCLTHISPCISYTDKLRLVLCSRGVISVIKMKTIVRLQYAQDLRFIVLWCGLLLVDFDHIPLGYLTTAIFAAQCRIICVWQNDGVQYDVKSENSWKMMLMARAAVNSTFGFDATWKFERWENLAKCYYSACEVSPYLRHCYKLDNPKPRSICRILDRDTLHHIQVYTTFSLVVHA